MGQTSLIFQGSSYPLLEADAGGEDEVRTGIGMQKMNKINFNKIK